jgi:Family of unknown function (DUF5995)
MRSIVASAKQERSAIGYFAAMYLGVTRVVRAGIDEQRFTTPDRLTDLTSVFALRYVDAWRAHRAGDPPSAGWAVAFAAADRWRPTVLQHLLLGMNVHINLDLAIASAQVAPGDEIHGLRVDFDAINDVLAGLIQKIQDDLNLISPLYRFIDDVTGRVDRAVVNFSIARARAEAWKLATFLAVADPPAMQRRITEHDRLVAALGGAILRPGPLLSSALLAVRLTEKRNPAAIIDTLSSVVTRGHP